MYTHIFGCKKFAERNELGAYTCYETARSESQNELVYLPSACANLRRAARIVTQLYDNKLRQSGIKATQFTLLQALARTGNISQGELGDLLGLDSTTLTRTLALVRRKGWIQAKPGDDRRKVRLTLTREGRIEYQSAQRYWQSAQRQLRTALGEPGWKHIVESTICTAAVVRGR